MGRHIRNYFAEWGVLAFIALLMVVFAQLAVGGTRVHADVDDTTCRAAMVLDRSGSVGEGNLVTMRNQIQRLFQPTGLWDDKIELAFWSFSDSGFVFPGFPTPNYDAPFNPFVSSKGQNTDFTTNLNRVQSVGNTNYEQGFGYSGGVMNTQDGIDQTINKSDIIVFMTDGQPNSPGGEGNARTVARQAVVKHLAAGRIIIGGLVGNIGANNLNFVVNGNDGNATNTFRISTNYNDLATQLRTQIGTKCRELHPPCQYNASIPADSPDCKPPEAAPYSLIPSVTASGTVISGSDSAGFAYKVNNDSQSTTSGDTHWTVKRLVVDRGQSVDQLYYTTSESYRDGYSCDTLRGLVAGNATCDEGTSGTRTFGPGATVLSTAELGSVANTTVDDAWQVGTKLCYVFTIDKPTQKDTPTNRYSRAACVIVGKRPTVQVHGGDVTAGRYFNASDLSDTVLPNVRGSITTKSGSINKTFGSWAEYGIFAPGTVSGFASAAGFQGGYDGAVASNPDLWSILTFSNEHGEYGRFTDTAGLGAVTNMSDYFLHGRTIDKDLTTVNTVSINGNDAPTGLYQKTNGDLAIDASTLEKGKTVIVSVPEGTVTIKGNIAYNQGPYQSIEQLPQLVIIAKSIVIAANVSNVDAWLIAQDSSGNGGTITTCDQPGTLTSEMCNVQLTVNGPVIAKQMQLRRTGGAGVGAASGDPAEVFNLRADSYLWGFGEGRSSVRAQTTNTIELPPQF
jgi:hypothetical protein